MEYNIYFELLIAFFSCIGVVSAFWYLVGLIYRRYIAKERVFTIIKLRRKGPRDILTAKRALWYADNFTSDEVFVLAESEEDYEELKEYCLSLYVTKMAEAGEVCDLVVK